MTETTTERANEIWREVPGYEGLYWVSDHCRVRSRKGLMKGHLIQEGRPQFCLSRNGTYKRFYSYALMMAAFVGPRPEGYHIAHEDGDPTNNALSNLSYKTAKGNAADRLRHGTHRCGERHAQAKITEEQALEIRFSGQPVAEIAEATGLTIASIKDIRANRTWRHLPFRQRVSQSTTATSKGGATEDQLLHSKLKRKLDRVHPGTEHPDLSLLVELTYGEIERLSAAISSLATPPQQPSAEPGAGEPWKRAAYIADALRNVPDEQIRAVADAKDVAACRHQIGKVLANGGLDAIAALRQQPAEPVEVDRHLLQAIREFGAVGKPVEVVLSGDGSWEVRDRAVFAAPSVPQDERELWKHLKRGTVYEVIGRGELQMGSDLVDGSAMVIYRGDDGRFWVREESEFEDGRFVRVDPRP